MSIHLEVVGVEIEAARGGDAARGSVEGKRGQLDHLVDHRSLDAGVLHRLTVNAAAVHFRPS